MKKSGKDKVRQNMVSDDTLEFLSLDDETIEAYERASQAARPKKKTSLHKKSKNLKKREVYEEEDDVFEEIEEIEDEELDNENYEYYEEDEEADDGNYEYYGEDEEADDENYEYYGDDEEADDENDEYYGEDDDENYEYYGEDEEIDDDDFEYYENYDEIDEDEEEDEDEDEDDYPDNIFARFGYFVVHMSPIDRVVAIFGCFIVIAAVAMGIIYAGARSVSKQVEAFAEIGTEVEGIHVIGESGLLAVSNAESARLSQMLAEEELPEEETQSEENSETNNLIDIGLNLTSIQSDIKIKFINKGTGKLISGVPFEAEVSGDNGKSFSVKDDDKDGIIYQTGVAAGTYTVKAVALQGEEYQKYRFPAQGENIKVTDTIAYKKVDVADEIKTEAEVNVAAEDTAVQDTVVESSLTDTVEWVESTRTEKDADGNYQEIKLEEIPDPSTIGRAGTGAFVKLANTGTISPRTEGGTGDTGDNGNTGEDGNNKDNNNGNDNNGNNTGDNEGDNTGNNNGTGDNTGNNNGTGDNTGNNNGTGDNTGDNNGTGDNTGNNNGTGDNTGDNNGTGDNNSNNNGDGNNTGNENNPPQPTDDEKLNALNPQLTSSITLTKGSSQNLSVSLSGSEKPTIEWSSSDSSVASVNNGAVKGEKAGKAEITAKVTLGTASRTLKCSVTVTETEVKYKSITITGSGNIPVGKTGAVKGTTDPAGGTVIWKSDNENVVKVDSNGTLTGVSVGTATITGTCGDAKNTWKVTVYKDVSGDTKTKLKDKNGNQIYIKNAEGKYVEATYADYYKNQKFYLRKANANADYFYTGWQKIDGYTYFFDKNGNYVTGEQVIQGAKYSFGSDGKLSSGSGSLGIDVSKWNGSIDWNAVKNSGISYVIIRCGYRGSSTGALIEDPKFRSNIQGAKAAGLKVGVYFFSQAVNEVEAVEEASMALSLVNGYGLNYPIFLDVESSGGRGDAVDAGTRTAVCKAFCNTIQSSGYTAGIYANKTWFTTHINTGSLTGYKIWLAQYASAPTYNATRYDMWQYSSKGTVSGISGNVDMNISYMNY